MLFRCILTFLLLFCIQWASSKIVKEFYLERVIVAYQNIKFGDVHLRLEHANRTIIGMSGNLTVKKLIPSDSMGHAIVYKNDNGALKETAYQVHKNICDILAFEYQIVWADLHKKGLLKNFLQKCPINPGFYYFNRVPIPSNVPYTPPWRLMVGIKVNTKDTELLEVNTYAGFRERVV